MSAKKAAKPKKRAKRKATKKQQPKAGRPCTYSRKVADQVLMKIAEGQSLRQIARQPGMPPPGTVRQWVVDDRDGIAERYAHARALGLDAMAEEALEIADDGTGDQWRDDEGNVHTNHDVISRSKLRVDARKWFLSKLKPDVYGDRTKLEHAGPAGGPIEVTVTRRVVRPG